MIKLNINDDKLPIVRLDFCSNVIHPFDLSNPISQHPHPCDSQFNIFYNSTQLNSTDQNYSIYPEFRYIRCGLTEKKVKFMKKNMPSDLYDVGEKFEFIMELHSR